MEYIKLFLLKPLGYLLSSILIFKLFDYFVGHFREPSLFLYLIVAGAIFIIAFAIIFREYTNGIKEALTSSLGVLLITILIGWLLSKLLNHRVKYAFIIGLPIIIIPILLENYIKIKGIISDKAKAKRNNRAAQEKLVGRLSALSTIEKNGYFKDQTLQRLKAFNANPECLNANFESADRSPRRLWLSLDEQLEYLQQNESLMRDLSLNSRDYNYSRIITRSFHDMGTIMGSNEISDYIKPLEDIYSKYNFAFRESHNALSDAIYSYNNFYENASRNFYNELKGKSKGITGEKVVNEALEIYKDVIWNLSSIRLEVEGESIESDNILISDFGVFSLEVKNYGANGDTIYIAQDGQWTIEHANGKIDSRQNVATQLGRHIGYKQRFINTELRKKLSDDTVPYILLLPLIVIANENVTIVNESDLPIVRPSNIYFYMMKHRSENPLDQKYWPVIKEIILENNLPPQNFPIDDYFGALKVEFNQLWEQIKAYYALSSIAKTYVYSLIEQGCDLTDINLDQNGNLEYIDEAQLWGDRQNSREILSAT